MMPNTASYMSSGGNGLLQPNAVVPSLGVTNVPMMIAIRNAFIVETYLSRQSMGIGITMIVVGVLSFISIAIGFEIETELYVKLSVSCGLLVIPFRITLFH